MPLRHALIPLHGYGIAAVTAALMLDPEGVGAARLLAPTEPVPSGVGAVLVADTSVYSAVRAEQLLNNPGRPLGRPWLVLIADAPVRPTPEARYRLRALGSRLAGTAVVPYLSCLRDVTGPEAAMEHKPVRAAAAALRRQIEGT
ncbi:hypothetical protein ACIQCG_01005 [Streptomyces noursei]|uniref:hypothetical protein n=1 Tax=Streptomyces noursei TaxID=1971 RepID=UPI00382BB811